MEGEKNHRIEHNQKTVLHLIKWFICVSIFNWNYDGNEWQNHYIHWEKWRRYWSNHLVVSKDVLYMQDSSKRDWFFIVLDVLVGIWKHRNQKILKNNKVYENKDYQIELPCRICKLSKIIVACNWWKKLKK